MSADLPWALRQAIERRLQGVSRRDLGERAQRISRQYRQGGGSAGVVTRAPDALAYALTRLPATYAACAAVFSEARRMAPAFAPGSLLDAGAGPGGAAWAAVETWPAIDEVRLLDHNPAFLELAAELAAQGPPALAAAQRLRGDLARAELPPADLVVASYALAELADPARAVERLWAAARDLLALVEPGTPAGFARLRAARTQLIAGGARIAAPCPHEADCPLVRADWCHFSQRLPRSRDHRRAKAAEVPFEDEKFAYLVAARPHIALASRAPRILAPPRAGKPGIELKLCGPQRLESRFVARRDKTAFAAARRLGWGDVLLSPEAKPEGRG